MALHGDFSSFPLPELLQWLDSSRKTGTLQLLWEGGERKLFLASGQVIATSNKGLHERIARMLAVTHLASGERVLAGFQRMVREEDIGPAFAEQALDPTMVMGLAREELYGSVADLTTSEEGGFDWTEDTDRGKQEWVPLELSLRALLFESLRWLDEAPLVMRALPEDSVTVKARVKALPEHPLLYRILLTLTENGTNLGRLRLTMGLSRSAAARRVYDLMRLKLVEVEGVGELAEDPVAQMLEKGLVLVQEQQFDAAGLVFGALLQADPADRRVREFARIVEGEHIAALYRDLPPLVVFELIRDAPALARLRPEERHVASLVNGVWDVSTIALASQARELETLKALAKLNRMGLLRVS